MPFGAYWDAAVNAMRPLMLVNVDIGLLAVLVWLRRRLPALRPDKFVELGWMVLLPAVLLQDLVVAVVAAVTR